MPFKTIAKIGKSKKNSLKRVDVLKNVPGMQTRQDVSDIVLEVIRRRRTVRKFNPTSISDVDLMKIIDAARYAPSAGNQQPWEFIIIKTPESKHKLIEACFGQEWIETAPVLIVVALNMRLATSKFGERGEKLYGIQATAAAIENMFIAAESLGISSAWIGAFSEKMLANLTYCPDYVRPCAVIAFGYADEEPPVPPRQNIKEFTHFERFGDTYLTKELYNNVRSY